MFTEAVSLEDRKTSHVHGLAEYHANYYADQSHLQIQCNPHQNSNDILHRSRKKPLKFLLKYNRRPQIAKAILSKKSNAGGVTIHDLKLYYGVTVTKTV
jgi:hypothetical protein